MKQYFHGTSSKAAMNILLEGIKFGEQTGHTFGPGLYLCENLSDAQEYGMVVLSVTVNTGNMIDITIKEDDIVYENDRWSQQFMRDVLDQGYKSVRILREDGFNEVVVFDVAAIEEIKEIWRSPLVIR